MLVNPKETTYTVIISTFATKNALKVGKIVRTKFRQNFRYF